MLNTPANKYQPYPTLSLPDRRWPEQRITRAPRWLSTDLRDGNQALAEPMDSARKLQFWNLLLGCGFKEIEVAFPSASQTDVNFVRQLIEENRIPDDVTIQVLTQARDDLIRRTFESLRGAKQATVHLYNATAPLFRRLVFGMEKAQVVELATRATRLIRQLCEENPDTRWQYEYSPETFCFTEPAFALEICEAVAENLSIGRVQGPTLAFVVDKELIIRNHVPVPYWSITAKFEKDGHIIKAHYFRQRIETLSESTSILHACSSRNGKVTKIRHQRNTLCAPHPFSLADLQKEAYRVFRFSPSYTLSIAEKLYIAALISYPRTSSQKTPSSINYRNIIADLSRIAISSAPEYRANSSRRSNGVPMSGPYTKITMDLLSNSRNLTPNEGKKTDPAHPAIYPTGENPRGRLNASEFKLFDLIIRRFLATFGQSAISQHTLVTIFVIDKHFFEADAKMMIDEGWMLFYKPYISSSLGLGSHPYLQNLNEGNILKKGVVTMTNEFTQPPTRFNQSSLLEEIESKNIGTKATRSEIISTLFKRSYISNILSYKDASYSRQYDSFGGGIEATDLGVEIVQSMRRYIPNIVSIDLTRAMEELLENIALGNDKSDSVIKYAKAKLKEAIIPFKEKETEIGNRITDAINATKIRQELILGTCPVCGRGSLKIIRSSKTKKRFVGCSNYTSGTCKATVPLPQNGSISLTDEICSSCRWPVLENTYFHGAKYRWKFCININCPSKKK